MRDYTLVIKKLKYWLCVEKLCFENKLFAGIFQSKMKSIKYSRIPTIRAVVIWEFLRRNIKISTATISHIYLIHITEQLHVFKKF